MVEENIDVLEMPVKNKVGALKKVQDLTEELKQENLDWRYVVNGLRAYLFDYLYDTVPNSDQVLPVIFHYIKGATDRKGNSAIRACDTFFDRYVFVLESMDRGDGGLEPVKLGFDAFLDEYIDVLIEKSKERFYFENVFNKILRFGNILVTSQKESGPIIRKMAYFLLLQYKLHIGRSIVSYTDEVDKIEEALPKDERGRTIVAYVEDVKHDLYIDKIAYLENLYREEPERFFDKDHEIYNFGENTKKWEKICSITRNSIERGWIDDENAILTILTYIVTKSNQGADLDFQRYMSRTLASICSILIENDRIDLFKKVIDLIMPSLFSEIEKDGNYVGAFARIYDIGRSVIESNEISLIDYYEDILIRSRFCFPEYSGISPDWAVISNASHLENIRCWMKLIEHNPPVMKKLSASLIVNLKLGGVFLKDTDVFQKDITRLLNSDYGDVFYLITSLAAVFPAYYHNIGATGVIRSFTERIDTNHQMNDLIHFIRKQVHVESSNRTVTLIQRVMDFWITGDKNPLENMVPSKVYNNLDHLYRMTNLDREPVAERIYQEARGHFKDLADKRFWDFLNAVDRKQLLDYIDEHQFDGIDEDQKRDVHEKISEYYQTRSITETTKILQHISKIGGIDTRRERIWDLLYEMSDDDFRNMFELVGRHDVSQVNIEKFVAFINVYRMLFDKYNFSEIRAIEKLRYYSEQNLFNPPRDFFDSLRGDDPFVVLEELLKMQEVLKSEVLLSNETFEPLDTIQFKRHIAFGIPSMYGEYKERKFDTLKVFFHINLIILRSYERIIEDMESVSDSSIDYEKIKRVLKLFHRTYAIDGLANQEMINVFNLLETPNLRASQFKDIINQLLIIHGGISDRFNETFRYVCKEAINNIGIDKVSRDFNPNGGQEDLEVIIDRFLRSQIMQSPLLQLFDNLLITLKSKMDIDMGDRDDRVSLINDSAHLKLGFNASDVIKLPYGHDDPPIRIDHPNDGIYGEMFDIKKIPKASRGKDAYAPIWKVGNKAYGLLFMKDIEGIHIPDGIILSSYLHGVFEKGVLDDHALKEKMILLLKGYVDSFTGGRFGNPKDPQLLSVRSGAVFFMPGVMNTITNVGMTQEIIDHYAREDMWFAYDCYRRFLQDIATAFYDIDRRVYENLMSDVKYKVDVHLKEQMSGEQMKVLAQEYQQQLTDRGYYLPDDPYEQLLFSIIAAYRSWDCSTAKNYRKFLNISDEWGTAVILQNMIFGNRSPSDITGVVQSNYHGDEDISLFGEYKTRAQGYDVVSGVAKVFPISEDQKEVFPKYRTIRSLEESQPVIYKMMYDIVNRIRDKFGNEVQIEFTVEDNILHLLQVRGLADHKYQIEEIDEGPDRLQESFLGTGLKASMGAVSGRIVVKTERIDNIRKRFSEDKVILIRPETNPEDVVGLKKSDGILTCLGGMTSHAVLQMRRFGKPGVSDFSMMKIDEEKNLVVVNKGRGETIVIEEGDFITIDGSSGNVYLGYLETRLKKI